MDDVEAHVPGPGQTHHGVEVGAVVVERRADAVDDLGDLDDVGIEQAQRVGVGQHQAGDAGVGLRAQVVDVDAPVRVGGQLHDLEARHRHGRRVGAVGRVGREHLAAVLAPVLVVGPRQQHPGELAVRAGGGLQADVIEAGDLRQRRLQVPHQLERPLRARRGPAAGAGGCDRAARRRARAGAGCASSCRSRADRSPSRGRSCAWTGRRSGARSRAPIPRAGGAGRSFGSAREGPRRAAAGRRAPGTGRPGGRRPPSGRSCAPDRAAAASARRPAAHRTEAPWWLCCSGCTSMPGSACRWFSSIGLTPAPPLSSAPACPPRPPRPRRAPRPGGRCRRASGAR